MVDFTYNESKFGQDPLAKVNLAGFAQFALSKFASTFSTHLP